MRGSATFPWNTHLRDCYRRGATVSHIFHLYLRMLKEGVKPNKFTFSFLLKASASHSSPDLATALHAQIIKSLLGEDISLATSLLTAFSEFSCVTSARKVFDGMPERERDVPFWNSLLAAYARNAYVNEAHSVFREMGSCGAKPSLLTLSILLPVCDQKLGRLLHGYVYRNWAGVADVFLHNSLLDFYNKCGKVGCSRKLFQQMPEKDLVSWNMVICGYTRNGLGHEALQMFHLLLEGGVTPDVVTLETALQACAQVGDSAISDGELVHELLVQYRCLPNLYIENSILLMYCKCGLLEEAEILFQQRHVKNSVTWNIMIDGYIQNGNPWKALQNFKAMRIVQIEVTPDSFVGALRAAKRLGGLPNQSISIHCLAIVTGYDSNTFVNNSLIAVYGEYGNTTDASKCFQSFINGREIHKFTWNVMLSVYIQNGCFNEAIELLQGMENGVCLYDSTSLVNILLVCVEHLNLKLGKAAHGCIIRQRFDSDVFISTALLQLYIKCGLLFTACLIFSKMIERNLVSWNTMIFGCLDNGFPRASLNLFHLLQQKDGLIPDKDTIVGVANAISQRRCEQEGKYIHEYVVQLGLDKDEFVVNSLIVMYARFGELYKANLVFDKASKTGTATWNTMIAEFAHCGLPNEALAIFHCMKGHGILPDSITFLSLLPACAQLASLSCSMWIHSLVIKTGCAADAFVESALVNLYAKCGQIDNARFVFDQMPFRTVVSWNSMIWGYGMHGDADESQKLFLEMQELGIQPNIVTYLALLSACSHCGDVEKGLEYFHLMTEKHSNLPIGVHCSAMVDLLSRKGFLLEAIQFIDKMPLGIGASSWGALLGAAQVQGDLELGKFAASKLFELDPSHSGYHVLLANLYSEFGRWSEASMVRINMRELGLKKQLGWSIIEKQI